MHSGRLRGPRPPPTPHSAPYRKLEATKPLLWLTRLWWIMARSYATCTDLRMLDLRPSIIRSLSAVSSKPKGVTLSRGSHCLQRQTGRFRAPGATTRPGLIPKKKKQTGLTKSACCRRRAPDRACRRSPPVSAPPDGGRLWVGRGWAPRCAARPPRASLDR